MQESFKYTSSHGLKFSSSIYIFRYEAYALTGWMLGHGEPVLGHKYCGDVRLVVSDYFIAVGSESTFETGSNVAESRTNGSGSLAAAVALTDTWAAT